MVEWSITTDCKSVGFGLRGFESLPTHRNVNAYKILQAFYVILEHREGFEYSFFKERIPSISNIHMGIFFDDNIPHVSFQEFHEHILEYLAVHGWTEIERNKVKLVFEPMLGDEGKYKGIIQSEIDKGLDSLKEMHALPDDRLVALRAIMYEYLEKRI